MRTIDEIILVVMDGDFSEIEFWRRLEDKKMDYKAYDATPKRISSVVAALSDKRLIFNDLTFYRKDMCIHIEV